MSTEVRKRLTFYRSEDPDLFDTLVASQGRDGVRLLKQLIREAWARRTAEVVTEPASATKRAVRKAGVSEHSTSKQTPEAQHEAVSVLERFGLDPSKIVFEK